MEPPSPESWRIPPQAGPSIGEGLYSIASLTYKISFRFDLSISPTSGGRPKAVPLESVKQKDFAHCDGRLKALP